MQFGDHSESAPFIHLPNAARTRTARLPPPTTTAAAGVPVHPSGHVHVPPFTQLPLIQPRAAAHGKLSPTFSLGVSCVAEEPENTQLGHTRDGWP